MDTEFNVDHDFVVKFDQAQCYCQAMDVWRWGVKMAKKALSYLELPKSSQILCPSFKIICYEVVELLRYCWLHTRYRTKFTYSYIKRYAQQNTYLIAHHNIKEIYSATPLAHHPWSCWSSSSDHRYGTHVCTRGDHHLASNPDDLRAWDDPSQEGGWLLVNPDVLHAQRIASKRGPKITGTWYGFGLLPGLLSLVILSAYVISDITPLFEIEIHLHWQSNIF